MYIITKIPMIKTLLGRQYSSKGTYNKELLKSELENIIPDGYIVKINELTGFLFITKK
jgi:hypothetical protein